MADIFGACLATPALHGLILSLDVSAPKQTSSVVGTVFVSTVIGAIFLATDHFMRVRFSHRLRHPVLQLGVVSLVGSFSLFILLFATLALLGYAEAEDIFLEVSSIIFLGILLSFTVFAITLTLSAINWFVLKSREITLK